ncbi:MAG: hypothetical protein AAGF94_01040 [Pseudomonadota bacterium]
MIRAAALVSAMLAFSLFPLAVMLVLFGKCAAFYLLIGLALMNLVFVLWPAPILHRVIGMRLIDSHASPELFLLVNELSAKAAIPTPRIGLIDLEQSNALVTVGRTPKANTIILSRSLLQALPRKEAEAVVGQLIWQTQNENQRLCQFVTVFGSMITMILGGSLLLDDRRKNRLLRLYRSMLAWIAAPTSGLLVRAGYDPRGLTRADQESAETFDTPLSLARALSRLDGLAEQTQNCIVHSHPAITLLFLVDPFANRKLQSFYPQRDAIGDRIFRLERRARVVPR